MAEARWYDLGAVEALKTSPLQQIAIGRNRIALSYRDGVFGAISGLCNHVGGPLGEGHLDGWSAEDMEHNIEYVRKSASLQDGARALAGRAIDLSQTLIAAHQDRERVERAGRKGCPAVMPEAPAEMARAVEA